MIELKDAIHAVAETVGAMSSESDLFRMPVDRAFSVKGTGTVVTGTVWSGEVKRDSTVIVRPGTRSVRVRAIQHHGQAAELARAGERSALALVGVEGRMLEPDEVERVLAARRARWVSPPSRHTTGILSLYSRVARGADAGGSLT